jgi:hypothetical protein
MKSTTLQGMIKKIFSDEALKARFIASPESVISGYSLNDEETRAVMGTFRMAQSGDSTMEAAITAKDGWSSPAP